MALGNFLTGTYSALRLIKSQKFLEAALRAASKNFSVLLKASIGCIGFKSIK
jgi:hypothetical protein